MRRSVLRRGVVAMFIAGVGAGVFGFTSSAQAGMLPLFQDDDANVRVSGGQATAINQCINDAQDGVIQNQRNACVQVANSGNILSLQNVNVYVIQPTYPYGVMFSDNDVNLELSGGVARAINQCVNDAKDGLIQTQVNACRQVAGAGNYLSLEDVGLRVFN